MSELLATSATDVGRLRSQNQDCALVADGLVAVADGMGGHAGGDIAARTAVQVLAERFERQRSTAGLVGAAHEANRAILEQSERDRSLRGMGTTLSAAAIVSDDDGEHLAVVHVGDSRVYLRSRTGFSQLTADHSLVEEMVRHGELSPEEAAIHPQRHILTRALGIDPGVEVDAWTLELQAGARLLLCSDGLTNEVSDADIATILDQNPDRDAAAAALVARALEHGGSDNVTVVVADVIPGPEESGAGRTPAGAALAAAPSTDGRRARRRVAPGAAPGGARRPRPGAPPGASPFPPALARRRRRAERIVTPWSILFVVLFVGVLASAVGATEWFNNATYYIGTARGHIAIFQGRPGGFLWYHPKLVEVLDTRPADVFAPYRSLLRAGIIETSYGDAQRVADNLTHVNRFLALPGANATAAASGSATSTFVATSGTGATTSPSTSTTATSSTVPATVSSAAVTSTTRAVAATTTTAAGH